MSDEEIFPSSLRLPGECVGSNSSETLIERILWFMFLGIKMPALFSFLDCVSFF